MIIISFFTEAIPLLLGILVYYDLTSILTSSELGATGKLLILLKKFFYLLYMMEFLSREVADDGQQNVGSITVN